MILDVIVEDKKKRLPEHKKNISEIKMRELAEKYEGKKHGFYQALSKSGISIIGEFKNASPSLGKIKSKINLLNRIDEYNESVDAISCLTEEDHFDGNVDYLKKIRTITELPILRKDFMIDPYQFYEAKAIGADAVLLIAAILDDAQMKDFYQLSKELELDALVEVHDEKELERAMKIDRRNRKYDCNYIFLFFTGGFLLHIIWEAKSQYVYPYVFILLPCCAKEMALLSEKIHFPGKHQRTQEK